MYKDGEGVILFVKIYMKAIMVLSFVCLMSHIIDKYFHSEQYMMKFVWRALF